jgi:hypothetical protein
LDWNRGTLRTSSPSSDCKSVSYASIAPCVLHTHHTTRISPRDTTQYTSPSQQAPTKKSRLPPGSLKFIIIEGPVEQTNAHEPPSSLGETPVLFTRRVSYQPVQGVVRQLACEFYRPLHCDDCPRSHCPHHIDPPPSSLRQRPDTRVSSHPRCHQQAAVQTRTGLPTQRPKQGPVRLFIETFLRVLDRMVRTRKGLAQPARRLH